MSRTKHGITGDAVAMPSMGMGQYSATATQALNAVVSMAADGLSETSSIRKLEKIVKRNL